MMTTVWKNVYENYARRFLLTLLVLAALGFLSTRPLEAEGVRIMSLGGVGVDTLDGTPDIGLWFVDETLLLTQPWGTLIGLARVEGYPGPDFELLAGVGYSRGLDALRYFTIKTALLLPAGGAPPLGRIEGEVAHEGERLSVLLSERLEFGQQAFSSLTTVWAKYLFVQQFAVFASGNFGWDGEALTGGFWGYLEGRFLPFLVRAGGSLAGYHDASVAPATGLESSVLGRLGWGWARANLCALDLEYYFSGPREGRLSVSAFLDLRL